MKVLRVISLLLDYPAAEIAEFSDSLLQEINASATDSTVKEALNDFVRARVSGDLMSWQAEYETLFERGRALSLLLFEHVHGESRDRGQAMVDLMNQYKQAGLQVQVNELPDYLPLYLEFLSTQGEDNARLRLQEIAHILALLACRLERRGSDYGTLLEALLRISGCIVDLEGVKSLIAKEKPDNTAEALDKVWEEEAVAFGPDQASSGCGSGARKPEALQRRDQDIPVHWTDMHQTPEAKGGRLS